MLFVIYTCLSQYTGYCDLLISVVSHGFKMVTPYDAPQLYVPTWTINVNMFVMVAGAELFRKQTTRFPTVKYVSVFQTKQQQHTCFVYKIYKLIFF